MTSTRLRIASALVVSAALSAPARAENVVNQSVDVDIEVFVPCANGGAGEVVALSGPLHTLITSTINGNKVSGKIHLNPQGLSGVGLDTGDRYHGTGVTQDHFNGSLQNGLYTETFVNNMRIVGQGSGNNFTVHESFHITINANGEVSSFRENVNADCK
jgi:hypothetical protein